MQINYRRFLNNFNVEFEFGQYGGPNLGMLNHEELVILREELEDILNTITWMANATAPNDIFTTRYA